MPPLPHQTVIRLGLRLPPGRPGVELVPVDGECVVLSVNDGASPLEAGDVVELINDTAMTRLRGGMFAWRDLLSAGGDAVVRRAVTVTRRAGVDAEALLPCHLERRVVRWWSCVVVRRRCFGEFWQS